MSRDALREALLRVYDLAEDRPDIREVARAALEAEPVAGDGPETTCQRCERSNVWSWHAPSPLWNAVMRDPETGTDSWSIVCPPCFSELAERKNIGGPTIDGRRRLVWCFRPHDLDVADLWSDRDGRTWDDRKCLWVDARAALEAEPVGLDVERHLVNFARVAIAYVEGEERKLARSMSASWDADWVTFRDAARMAARLAETP